MTGIETEGTFSLLTEEEKNMATSILVEAEVENGSDAVNSYQSILIYFRKKLWTSQVQMLTTRLKQAQQDNNVEEMTKLLTQFELLKKKTIILGK